MFEKEAEEYFETECLHSYADTEEQLKEDVVPAFQKGAEFGYKLAHEEMDYLNKHLGNGKDKANEWHYVKDGLPKDTTSLYLVRVYSWNFSFSHLYKKYTTYIPTVCEWNGEYFTALDSMAHSNARNINSCIAWKEIVLSGLPKESD